MARVGPDMTIIDMHLIDCSFHPRVSDSVATHSHAHHEWHWIAAGRCRFAIAGHAIDLRPGDLFVIPPGIAHGLRITQRREWVVQYIVHVAHAHAEQALLAACLPRPPRSRAIAVGTRRHGLFESLRRDLATADPWLRRAAEHRFLALVNAALAARRPTTGDEGHPAIAACLLYMQRHIDRRITLDELAAVAGLDRSYLVRRFRREVGSPPLAHFTDLQMAAAGSLLRDRGCSVAETAERLGYSDSAVFSRAFKRHVGVAPAHYARA